nr:XTP/dITP diphosphatase [Heliophilum fasciatum]
MPIIVATRNEGKVRELAALTKDQDLPIQWRSLRDYPTVGELAETGDTFQANARMKAAQVVELTGVAALADDSGLVVDALQGAPGIYSARFAGEPKDDRRNIAKLLTQLEGVPAQARTARFVCALALLLPDGREVIVEGTCEGQITTSLRGDGGFGYDPVFLIPALGQTFAEIDGAEKNRRSHRAQAMQALIKALPSLLGVDKG